MLNQKEAKVVRESAYEAMKEMEFAGFTFYGLVQEGAVFEHEGNFILFKAIAKKDGFADEVDELMEEFQKKEAEKAEKAKAKAKE